MKLIKVKYTCPQCGKVNILWQQEKPITTFCSFCETRMEATILEEVEKDGVEMPVYHG